MVAGKRPDLVRGLVLADPVILAPSHYRMQHLAPFMNAFTPNRLASGAKKRRSKFGSMSEALDRYKGKSIFQSWREPFLADYLLDGLDRTDDLGADAEEQIWELLCTPKWEAATFRAQRNRPWSALKKIHKNNIPLTVLQASTGSVISKKSAERIQQTVPAATVKLVRGSSHFLPMEVPYSIRDELSGMISRLVEGFSAAEEGPVKRHLRS